VFKERNSKLKKLILCLSVAYNGKHKNTENIKKNYVTKPTKVGSVMTLSTLDASL